MRRRAPQRRPGLVCVVIGTVLLTLLQVAPADVRALQNATCAPTLPVGEATARAVLSAERPFAPTDPRLFHSWDHPAWADVPLPASPDDPGLDEQETREALRAFLMRRFPCAPDGVGTGLAIYDDAAARQKLPDPPLRAALAALVGTVGEPAIAYLLHEAPVTSVHFGVGFLPEDGAVSLRFAATWNAPDGTQQIVIDRKDRFSHFGAFSAMLFHEALHAATDPEGAGEVEEVIATALQALVYMEMLLADPAIAEGSAAFTRTLNNHTALLRLNSGPPGSDRMTLFLPGSDVNIDPTAVEPITQFYDLYGRVGAPADSDFAGRETPGNVLLRAVLEDLAEPGQMPPVGADFDAETLQFLDRNHATMTPAELIAVACILRLDVECG